MTEIEKLLAVKDMTEEEQWVYLAKAGLMSHPWNAQDLKLGIELWRWKAYFEREVKDKYQALLADLAFRLRDEVVKDDLANETGDWCEAEYEVFLHIIGEENEKDAIGLDTWCSMYATPIHWIVIAIRAKQLAVQLAKKE